MAKRAPPWGSRVWNLSQVIKNQSYAHQIWSDDRLKNLSTKSQFEKVKSVMHHSVLNSYLHWFWSWCRRPITALHRSSTAALLLFIAPSVLAFARHCATSRTEHNLSLPLLASSLPIRPLSLSVFSSSMTCIIRRLHHLLPPVSFAITRPLLSPPISSAFALPFVVIMSL